MKEKYEKIIERYGHEVLSSKEMQDAYNQKHHTWSTVGEHTLRVAAASLAICYVLRIIHIQTDIPSVVKGSLCHDLGILGRDTKYSTKEECARRHPADSVQVAKKLVKDLPEKSSDIIERHMWPFAHSKVPNSLEGVIVSTADKYAAVQDFVVGSEIKHTSIKNKVHDAFHAHR
ncbi:MAG: HD domain-containing protein [Oscillospiraceae bacterium]|nr:HD domain-containing protein [Oscillospiraceae bacterium]